MAVVAVVSMAEGAVAFAVPTAVEASAAGLVEVAPAGVTEVIVAAIVAGDMDAGTDTVAVGGMGLVSD
jgi:hypothetical protein